jgi:transposase InsO family protein
VIANTIKKYKLKNMITYLCKISDVSRSGYYRYFCEKAIATRKYKEEKDEILRENVLKAFNFKNRKTKGARQVKMVLKGEFNLVYNLKRIRRIMKKYNIKCTIRKANAYRRMMKATKEHTVLPNLLNRNFKQKIPKKVLLTDITYLNYSNGKRAYLSTIKDSSTNEILAHKISSSLKIDIVLDTIDIFVKNTGGSLREGSFIHSDQGVHYTSPKFQNKVKSIGLGQSMSRRGNCWDNAPQESFFGHFKDEVNLKKCNNLDEVKNEINKYMDYYNNHRYQWNLNKMTPTQYRDHLLVS